MPANPDIGRPGGQRYSVLRSIQTFLQQMAEGGARTAPTVIKELLQNADDAGASEVGVILDERQVPDHLPENYADLLAPSLLVRNNARFRLLEDCAPGEPDDFTAILDVASGHKRAQATAAGRFGIGFNSVYFLTDTPLLFSRHEVHVFDLLHRVFAADGWRFPLQDFPRTASHAGPVKNVIDWCLPRVAIGQNSFAGLAMEPGGDYHQTLFRLPLRRTAADEAGIYADRFPDPAARLRVLREMVQESTRSILFLKHVTAIEFSILHDGGLETIARVEASPPPGDFATFLQQIRELDRSTGSGKRLGCRFRRTITCDQFEGGNTERQKKWMFELAHVAAFDDEQLLQLRERLRRNGERAVPWAALAVPLDAESCHLDGEGATTWRVFLPLLEPGPSACVFNAHFFIGPSRQRIDFRLNESDEGRRRTEWNQALAERVLIPILQDLSGELPNLARNLLEAHPRDYLALFPTVGNQGNEKAAEDLTSFVRQRFSDAVWILRLPDIWGEQFDLLVGDEHGTCVLEMVRESLLEYRDRFRALASPTRRFIRHVLGEAVAARVGRDGAVTVRRQASADVGQAVLRHAEPPRSRDLEDLLRLVARGGTGPEVWDGAWALVRSEDGALVRYDPGTLYVMDAPEREHAALGALRRLPLRFERVEWVRPDAGLTAMASDLLRPPLPNIVEPTGPTALELLRRLPEDNRHDQLAPVQARTIKPIMDFLAREPATHIPSDARLGFVIRTAGHKEERRNLGVILLRPSAASPIDEALWDVWFRRIFAEVDPAFAVEVHSLLRAHPHYLRLLGSQDCLVAVGDLASALSILHSARLRQPEVYGRLEEAMNRQGTRGEGTAVIASALIDVADGQWDRLDVEERYSVLALPIHRRPDGRYVGLVPASDGDVVSIANRFRLQSDEQDIEDAPISLPARELLQTATAATRRFYRRRLGLEEHGRVAVLKDVLLQIGTVTADASQRMLRYLVQYYEPTVRQLESTGDEVDRDDGRNLRRLFESARTVPCLDGPWRRAAECVAVTRAAEHLTRQGWERGRVASLLGELFDGGHLATIDPAMRRLVHQLHELAEHDPRGIAGRAVASNSTGLSFADRVKLLRDNWRDLPSSGISPSAAASQLPIPVLAGQASLGETELLDKQASRLPVAALRVLAPNAIDVRHLGKELGVEWEQLIAVLEAFRVPSRSGDELDTRLRSKFAQVWPELRSDESRLQLIRYIGERGLATNLRPQAMEVDAVRVASRPPGWQRPAHVVTPRLAETEPPYIAAGALPALGDIPHSVRDVWDAWCGVSTFGELFAQVLDGARRAGDDPRTTARAIYRWLQRAVEVPVGEDVRGHLRARPWVLALRGGATEFRRPGEVLVHEAERILSARFWVPAIPLPDFVRDVQEQIGFMRMPAPIDETLQRLGECLAEPATSSEPDAVRVYALVEQICDQADSLGDTWRRIATELPVYRAFRQEERQLTSRQLFIGDDDYDDDLSRDLLCLRARSRLPRSVPGFYRRLGVVDRPTVQQVLLGLASLGPTAPEPRAAHGRLVEALEELSSSSSVPIEGSFVGEVRVLSCAGTYEPVARCYYDDDFGRRGRVALPHAARLIDTSDRNTSRQIDWLRKRGCDVPVPLRRVARAELVEDPQPTERTPDVSYILLPWEQWVQEAVREGSTLGGRLADLGLRPPDLPVAVVPVERIRVRFRLADGEAIEQSPRWAGPVAFGDGGGAVLVRGVPRQAGSAAEVHAIAQLDENIAREIAILMGGSAILADLQRHVEGILATLERPSTVLRRLRETYRKHFLHQYHDQVANPEFARLFEEYQRTVQSRAGALEERMYALLEDGFVHARREQIRDYGYDEFSVFAELLQNAEDAYIQRARLGMEMPAPCDITYRYTEFDRRPILEIEHRGRPFNYWQHGSQQDWTLSRDVEGVLRSAGSFKPYSERHHGGVPDAPTTGRFGLGFKSVYLLTDRPEIHSGPWHFAVESGCLPREMPLPRDLAPDVTLIRLPLRADVRMLEDGARLLDLLPFLRMVGRLEFRAANGTASQLDVACTTLTAEGSTIVEHVAVSGSERVHGGVVRFLRCRSLAHAGQLALLLGPEGMPARWDESFSHDIFAALPLRARLGCGVAVSHGFDVQSGRTHLVQTTANASRAAEIADLLAALVNGLSTSAVAGASRSRLLARFWGLWRWEQGDAECAELRRILAHALVALAGQAPVVPTLDPQHPTSLAHGPCFFFSELPDAFREALLNASVAIIAGGLPPTVLTSVNVVADGFAAAYRRACECAGVARSKTLVAVGWNEVAATFRERPWFAEEPSLLSCLAAGLNEEQARRVAGWVSLCLVLGSDGAHQVIRARPGELMVRDFPGMQHLPARLLRLISSAYDAVALDFLRFAGLRDRPSSDEMREWVTQRSLSASECVGILRYLGQESRFKDYWDLASLFRSAWFPGEGRRISTAEGIELGLIPGDAVAGEVFRAWLGLTDSIEAAPPIPPRRQARDVLEDLFGWWREHGTRWTARYEQRLYPVGRPPAVRDGFYDRDPGERREWLTLLLLGALHTMGRPGPEPHRDFLRRCDQKGWLDVFAAREPDAGMWMQVLEQYLDDPSGKHEYYHWMRQFVAIFQISRWLPAYVEAFLNVARFTRPFALDEIIAPRTSPAFSGGGPDAPPLTRALGIGACFVLRELARIGIIRQRLAHPYCYVPTTKVCRLLDVLGAPMVLAAPAADRSAEIHRLLVALLGGERATFLRAFDLPLIALAEDQELQERLLGRRLDDLDGR